MKIDKITPQIAALYLGQKCTYSSKVLTEDIETEINARVLSDVEGDIAFASITPHLRRLESLTEDEARELYGVKYGEKWEKSFHDISINVSPCIENFWKEDIELYAPEGKLLIGSPAVWLKLLEWGIDLFGLIDAGLAKEIKPN